VRDRGSQFGQQLPPGVELPDLTKLKLPKE